MTEPTENNREDLCKGPVQVDPFPEKEGGDCHEIEARRM